MWHASLTVDDKMNIERVQRAALQVILGDGYTTYSSACELVGLTTLESRRIKLCKKFAHKASLNPKHKQWFKINRKQCYTRSTQPPYCPVIARTKRFYQSPISYLTRLLNTTKK